MTADLSGRDFRAGRTAAPQSGGRFLVTLSLLTLMLPITFTLGSLTMTPSRALFMVLMPIQLIGLLSGRFGKITYVDWLILAYMFWRTFVPFYHNPNVALQYAGSNSIIFLGGYMAARALVRTVEDFQYVAKLLGLFVLFSFPFAIYETVTTQFVLPKLFEMIPGVTSVKDVNYIRRMGLDRVQFVFSHPIHYGLFVSLVLSIWFISLRGVISGFWRWTGGAIIIACCFFSVSSGPFLSLMVQIALAFYAYIARNLEKIWLRLGLVFGIAYLIIELASNRPAIVAVTSRLTFNSSTANVRFILFDYGMAQVWRTPILGIGFRQWDLPSWMTGSLDNFWLGLALVFGVPAFLFLFLAMVTALVGIGKRPFKKGGPLANARLGWGITMVSLMLTLATVYVWSEVASLMMFMIGAGVFMLTATDRDAEGEDIVEEKTRGGMSFTRFAPEATRTGAPARPAAPATRNRTGRV